ncbi:hypothetical protein ARMSODRAFT_985926 [Armillaria solidipes]|uniref:Protein kinase domain-containing protein n=1 Tax=Armillaria solidipes TaxID=1076256 RepID=A0A2H3CFC1_9AGAR|nr:hypothetical protein ARMSODRAFT_985926 [Armillaria solidipes]
MGSNVDAQMRTGRTRLLHGEIFWNEYAAWLKECGYELRPRLRPGWIPSWTVTKKEPYECEDSSFGTRNYAFMDAKDASTGHVVAMKRINQQNYPNELAIATFLTSEEKSSDRRNHCVPILRILPVPNEEGPIIIFRTISEGVQFFREILEFIHHNRVAHYDGGFTNHMMDATSMYGPDSFHPDQMDLKYDFSSRARHRSRTERPPKYYFIDFGLSFLYKPDELPATTKRRPKHDPFAVDIYYLGNAFRAFLRRLRGMKGFEFMEPLIAAMAESDLAKRIKIDEAVEKSLSAMTLRSRVVYNTDFTIFRPFKAIGLIARGIPAIPTPLSQ